jgi:hypothetical protein
MLEHVGGTRRTAVARGQARARDYRRFAVSEALKELGGTRSAPNLRQLRPSILEHTARARDELAGEGAVVRPFQGKPRPVDAAQPPLSLSLSFSLSLSLFLSLSLSLFLSLSLPGVGPDSVPGSPSQGDPAAPSAAPTLQLATGEILPLRVWRFPL